MLLAAEWLGSSVRARMIVPPPIVRPVEARSDQHTGRATWYHLRMKTTRRFLILPAALAALISVPPRAPGAKNDSLTVFAIDPKKGTLNLVQNVPTQGSIPRNFKIDPTEHYLFVANQKTNNIVTFRIDPKTGHLSPTGQVLEIQAPVCLQFVPGS